MYSVDVLLSGICLNALSALCAFRQHKVLKQHLKIMQHLCNK